MDVIVNGRQPDTWLLTGVPRSGSSLACRLAGELPDVVALSEPVSRKAFAGLATAAEASDRLVRFAIEARRLVEREQRAPSLHVGGRLDDNVVAEEAAGGLRRRQAEQGEICIDKPLTDRFTLLVKHNALFAALLPELTVSLPCLALVRNPLVVLASWQTVDLPVNRGRVPAGEQYDSNLRNVLDRTEDVLRRQLVVLNWFFERYAGNLPDGRILRYEDLIASGGRSLFRLLDRSGAPAVPLASRNDHAVYRGAGVDKLLAALVKTGGAWTRFYDRVDCRKAADRLAQDARYRASPAPGGCR